MAAMGVRVPEWTWPPGAARLVGFTACAVAGAVLARPHTGRPVIDSARWHNVLLLHRNTLLSAGFVVLVATEPPKVWEAAVDAALLAGYLLMLDAVTMPVPVLRRVAGPWFLLGLAGLVAAATAIVALPGSDATVRKVVVAVAAATVLTVAVAAGFRAGDTRRVGSRGIPKADPKK
jgi:hypothetical protein